MLCVFESYRAAKRVICVEFVEDFDVFGRARVAMQKQSAIYIRFHIEKYFSCVFVSVSYVQNNRKFDFAGKFDLLAKRFLLQLTYTVVVIIIKPDFAYRNRLVITCEFSYHGVFFVVCRIGIVRMYSGGKIQAVVS